MLPGVIQTTVTPQSIQKTVADPDVPGISTRHLAELVVIVLRVVKNILIKE